MPASILALLAMNRWNNSCILLTDFRTTSILWNVSSRSVDICTVYLLISFLHTLDSWNTTLPISIFRGERKNSSKCYWIKKQVEHFSSQLIFVLKEECVSRKFIGAREGKFGIFMSIFVFKKSHFHLISYLCFLRWLIYIWVVYMMHSLSSFVWGCFSVWLCWFCINKGTTGTFCIT